MPSTSKWTDYPYSLKAEGDWFYTLGVNRFVFHTFVHQPYTTGFPGMTMGPFSTHFDRNNTWTEQAYGWGNYLRRSQYLLQQGLTVADICYFKGDEPESGVPDIYPIMPAGIKGDVAGRDALFIGLTGTDADFILGLAQSRKNRSFIGIRLAGAGKTCFCYRKSIWLMHIHYLTINL